MAVGGRAGVLGGVGLEVPIGACGEVIVVKAPMESEGSSFIFTARGVLDR